MYFPFKRAAANDDALRVRCRDRPFKQCMRDVCRVPLPCLCDPKEYCFTLKVCPNIRHTFTFGRIDTLSFSVFNF